MNLRVIAQTGSTRYSPPASRTSIPLWPFLGLAAATDTPVRSAVALAHEVPPRSATAKVESALTELGQTLPQKESAVNENDIEDRLNLNSGTSWSDMDTSLTSPTARD